MSCGPYVNICYVKQCFQDSIKQKNNMQFLWLINIFTWVCKLLRMYLYCMYVLRTVKHRKEILDLKSHSSFCLSRLPFLKCWNSSILHLYFHPPFAKCVSNSDSDSISFRVLLFSQQLKCNNIQRPLTEMGAWFLKGGPLIRGSH